MFACFVKAAFPDGAVKLLFAAYICIEIAEQYFRAEPALRRLVFLFCWNVNAYRSQAEYAPFRPQGTHALVIIIIIIYKSSDFSDFVFPHLFDLIRHLDKLFLAFCVH